MYEALKNGSGIYLNQHTAVYRIHDAGIWAMKLQAEKSKETYLIHQELASLHPNDEFVVKQYCTKTKTYIESHSDKNVPNTATVLLAPIRFFLVTKDTKRALMLYKRIIVDFVIKGRLL